MERQLTTINKIISTIDFISKEKGIDMQEIRFTFSELYEANPDVPKESIRARVYEKLGVLFKRVGRGIYAVLSEALNCIVIEGDSREMSFIPDEFAQLLVNDHPWEDLAANRGGNRNFAPYDCFKYTLDDFKEKFRVLQKGGFLVEFLPAELDTNFEYLYQLKKMAIEAGFKYYSKVTWIKKGLIRNTGRKAKNSEEVMIFKKDVTKTLKVDAKKIKKFRNKTYLKYRETEDVMVFTKGRARKLRLDEKKIKRTGMIHYMSGATKMLPASFNVPPVPVRKRSGKCPSEKPVELLRQIISLFTKPGEIVIDQYAGSGVTGEACLTLEEPRQCILIEKSKEYIEDIVKRLNCVSLNGDLSPAF